MLHFQGPDRWKNVDHLAFFSDSSALLGGCAGSGAVCWDVRSGAIRSRRRVANGAVSGLLRAPDDTFVCVPSGWFGLVHLNCPELEPLSSDLFGRSGYVRFAALAPDGTRVLRTLYRTGGATMHGIAVVGAPPNWERQEWESFEPGWIAATGTFLAGGDRVVTVDRKFPGTGPSRVSVWDAATGALVRSVPCPAKEFGAVVPSGDGRWLVLVTGRTLWVWDAVDWAAAPRKCPNDTRFHFTGIAFHPSGRYLAATSNDATVKLYDTTTWEVARAFTWNIGRMRSIAFSPDGALAAAGSDTGKVVVWDVDL